jgi:hypothetical protein
MLYQPIALSKHIVNGKMVLVRVKRNNKWNIPSFPLTLHEVQKVLVPWRLAPRKGLGWQKVIVLELEIQGVHLKLRFIICLLERVIFNYMGQNI